LTADSDTAEEPKNDTHKKGANYHGRKADFPIPVFVEPVKIFPAVFFRTENNFVKVEGTIKDDRKNSQERKRERERISTFQKTKRNNGKQRPDQMKKKPPAFQLIFIAECRTEKDHDCQKGYGYGSSSDILQQPDTIGHAAMAESYSDCERHAGTEHIGKYGEKAKGPKAGSQIPDAFFIPKTEHEGNSRKEKNDQIDSGVHDENLLLLLNPIISASVFPVNRESFSGRLRKPCHIQSSTL
jgi:hypothetical protein